MANYDIIGDICIIKFNRDASEKEKKQKALEMLKERPNVKTVVEKLDKVHGRLRTIKTKFLAGEKKLETICRENNSLFKLNIETCYFSPRLANERLEVARMIKKNSSVLVMFAGVAPFSIAIAKIARPRRLVSMELGKECCKYASENVKKNKLDKVIEVVQGDVKRLMPKIAKKEKFDVVVMPRPNLSDTFFKEGLMASRKGTQIIYYGFSPEAKKDEMIANLEREAKKLKRKIKVVRVLEAGDIAPYEHRYRVEIKVLN